MMLILLLVVGFNSGTCENIIGVIRHGKQLQCVSEKLLWGYNEMVAGKYSEEATTMAPVEPILILNNNSCSDPANEIKLTVNNFTSKLSITCSPGWYDYCVQNKCSITERCRDDNELCLCIRNQTTVTSISGPKDIENFDEYAINGSDFFVRWDPPSFPNGTIEMYAMMYNVNGRYIRIQFKPMACVIWTWMHCTSLRITNFHYRMYLVKIFTKFNNSATWTPSMKVHYIKVPSSDPDPPISLKSSWDNFYNLTVEWQHPNKTNGVLQSFQLLLSNNASYTVPVGTPHLNYRYMISFPDSLNINVLKLNAVCKNTDLKVSKPSEINIDCPPQTPKLSQRPELIKTSDKSIVIQIPKLKVLQNNSFSYLHIIVAKNTSAEDPEVDPKIKEFISQFINLKPNMTAWLATEYIFFGNANVNLTIGNMFRMFSNLAQQEITNWDLPKGVYLKVYVVVINKRKEFLRFSTYELETELQRFSPFIYASFLLLLIPILLYVIYIVRKKRIRFVRL